jgi:hypothetical protein
MVAMWGGKERRVGWKKCSKSQITRDLDRPV